MEKHSFHIPVMGIGFTADSPLKVAPYGIDSVISLVDDVLLEKLRKYYTTLNHIKYIEISNKTIDYRAKRITAYLNLIDQLIHKKIKELKNINSLKSPLLINYIKHLPTTSELKKRLLQSNDLEEVKSLIQHHLKPGHIDVNIMTKIDKTNYHKKEALPIEFNDAHAALRGYANANISSSIVFSAGMNPKLFNYLEGFDDFFPDDKGFIKKKIILKVSDYRSALIQGKYLAKKGLWVSEYRIESGLNCGGHAFATDGFLIGPVLEEFKLYRKELYNTTYSLFSKALHQKNKKLSQLMPSLKLSAQGGVGTSKEHHFLLKHYSLDSVGWGTPFLLVPQATTVDTATMNKLINATEKDLYLSNISPLGVPFNNLRGNTKDDEKQINIDKNRPGSACPKKHVALNTEFKKEGLCTASREYQYLKIKELQNSTTLSIKEQKTEINKVTEKSCICVGLGTSSLINYELDTKTEGKGVSICPGPNLAYFTSKTSLSNMINHIYGTKNIIQRKDRPNMFLKELDLYVIYLTNQINQITEQFSVQQKKSLNRFTNNLLSGIQYYQNLFQHHVKETLQQNKTDLQNLANQYKTVTHLKTKLQTV
ncbi:hypothetical protein [Wenyingzhuangia sp. IMCC45467]